MIRVKLMKLEKININLKQKKTDVRKKILLGVKTGHLHGIDLCEMMEKERNDLTEINHH